MSDPVFPNTRLGVYAFENPNVGTPVVAGQQTMIALIGQSNGAVTTTNSEAVTRASVGELDPLANAPATSIVAVGDAATGLANYVLGTDYRLSNNGDDVEWLGTFVQPPVGLVGLAGQVTPASPRTGLAPATYSYEVTAIRQINAQTMANGETTVSNEPSVVVGGSNNSVALTWTPSVNAQGYNIYRNGDLIATVPGGASSSFLDDGYANGTVPPPGANTATNAPALHAIYYVTYIAVITSYQTPAVFTSLSQLIAAHGYGSDLAIAGGLILGGAGVGQSASQVMTIAVPDETEASYIAALAVLQTQKVDIIVALTGNPAIQLDVAEHVVSMSEPITKKNRCAIFGSPIGTPIGDVNTVNSLIWSASRLVLHDQEGNTQGKRIWYVDTSFNYNVQAAVGVFTATDLDGWFYAAAVAGMIAALPQVCTPPTNHQIIGPNSLDNNWNPAQRDQLDAAGILTSENTNGVISIYHGRTCDLFTVEHAEISIVRTSDFIALDLIQALGSYWGQNVTEAWEDSISDDTAIRFGVYQSNTIIAGFDADSIEVLAGVFGDPRRVDISVSATPLYPANQIVLQFSFA